MKTRYSFLTDELAIDEIRKHKWIESEKEGKEVGFATAAMDWIKKHGYSWKQFRKGLKDPKNMLAEKRRHRRFHFNFPVQLSVKGSNLCVQTNNINLIGLSCSVPKYIPNNTPAKVTIRFNKGLRASSIFQFNSRIARTVKPAAGQATQAYKIFLPFSEEVRDYIRLNAQIIAN